MLSFWAQLSLNGNVWLVLRCGRDVWSGRQLRDVLQFRHFRGLNGAGKRANWQPCATLKTGVWLASACVSISLFRSPSEYLVVYFGWHLCWVCLRQQRIQKWKKHLLIKLWFIQTLLMGLGLLYCLLDFWDFGSKFNLPLLVNTIWICICFLTSSCYFCLCSIYFPQASCSKSCHYLKRSRYSASYSL